MSPSPAPVPLGAPSPGVSAGCHAQTMLPGCGGTTGGTCQVRLLPALGMPVVILWERQELEGGKGPPGQTGTEPGTGSQPSAGKISEGFCTNSPSLLLRAARRCSHLPPSAPAIAGSRCRIAPSPPSPGRSRTKPPPSHGRALPPPVPRPPCQGCAASARRAAGGRERGEQGGQRSRDCLLL